MDARLRFRLARSSPVTSISYHPVRRETVTGHENGDIKTWEADTAKSTSTLKKHIGAITELVYWYEGRLLISCSIDGTIIQWSFNGYINGLNEIDSPIYSMIWHSEKRMLIAGLRTSLITLQPTDERGKMGLLQFAKIGPVIKPHTDIIKAIQYIDNRVFTVSMDKSLCVYEMQSEYGKRNKLNLITKKKNAHANGITCLKTSSKLQQLFTGGFDHEVKIWNTEAKLISSIILPDIISCVEYVPDTDIIWVGVVGLNTPFHYEASTGNKLSELLDPVSHLMQLPPKNTLQCWSYYIKQIKYIKETTELIGLFSTNEIVLLKYNHDACLSCHKLSYQIETSAYTGKAPLLYFFGTEDGEMYKWEKIQLNLYDFSKESLYYKEQLKTHLHTSTGCKSLGVALTGKPVGSEELTEQEMEVARAKLLTPEYRRFIKSIFNDTLDYLISSSKDGKIVIWGFDADSANALRVLDSQRFAGKETAPVPTEEDLVTYNRVAGFMCIDVLDGHYDEIQALVIAEKSSKFPSVYLISAGLDMALCVWDLKERLLLVKMEDCIPCVGSASGIVITDAAYSSEFDVFALSCNDSNCYLMSFGVESNQINLIDIIKGHDDEITQVCWSHYNSRWFTGSVDKTLRSWGISASPIDVLHLEDTVNCLIVNELNHLIVAGVGNQIRVYSGDLDSLVQVCKGHTMEIKTLIYVHEEQQYISTSRDGTLRVWNATSTIQMDHKKKKHAI